MKKKRKRIAFDEKEITINGTTIFICGAVDLNEKILAFCSFQTQKRYRAIIREILNGE